VPIPAFGTVFSGFEYLGVILVTAIPFGIYDWSGDGQCRGSGSRGRRYPTSAGAHRRRRRQPDRLPDG
jgi:AGZA family xanthine/uracil permease-like MFS transporter